MPQKTGKTFDEFPTVNCNYCSNYWNDSCDGVKPYEEKECRSFIATRGENFPKQLKELKIITLAQGVTILLVSLALILHIFTG